MHTYNDGLRAGGRRPRLYLAKGADVRKFAGQNIPDYCAIASRGSEQCGKWSNTTYQLHLAHGVRALELISPMHGTWGDDLGSWGEVAERLGLPVDVAQTIVRAEYGSTAERLDKLEAFAIAAEEHGASTEVVVVAFGAPTNRAIREGYWAAHKTAQASDGRLVVVQPSDGPDGPDWSQASVVAPSGATVMSSRHRPGMHGGYWTVEVAVPAEEAQQ